MVSRPMSCAREAFLADDVRDDRREADGEFVWLRYTHADAQRVLGICVNHEDFFALPRKPDSEARCRETFPTPSLAVCDYDCFAHVVYLPFCCS